MRKQLGFVALLISCVLTVHTIRPPEDAWAWYNRMNEGMTYIFIDQVLHAIPASSSTDPFWQEADELCATLERVRNTSDNRKREARGVELLSELVKGWVPKMLDGINVKDYFDQLPEQDKEALRAVKAAWQDRGNSKRGDYKVWNDLKTMHIPNTPASVIYARNIAKGCGIVAFLYGIYRLNEYRKSGKASQVSEQKS